MTLMLICVNGALTASVLFLLVVVRDQQREITAAYDVRHQECLLDIAAMSGAKHAETVLKQAALAWDSIEEKPNINRISREYIVGGRSVPSIWLHERAEEEGSRYV